MSDLKSNFLDASAEEIFPFQIIGKDFLKSKNHALLADKMGMGESLQSILAAEELGLKRILVLCHAVGRLNWRDEFNKWSKTQREFSILEKGTDLPSSNPESITITTYNYAADHPEILQRDYDVVILDEAHLLKEPKSKRTKAVLGTNGVIRKSNRVWLLTGTPAQNHYAELWVMLYTFGRTELKYEAFAKRYCKTQDTKFGLRIWGNRIEMADEVRAMLDGFMLRRIPEKGMLPDLYFSDVKVIPEEVDLKETFGFQEFYFPYDRSKELEERLAKETATVQAILDTHIEGKSPLDALQAMASSVSTLRKYLGLGKIGPVAELVGLELENNDYEKIVIFAVHRDVINGLRERLKKYKPVVLYGKMKDDLKASNIRKFQKDPKCRVFIGNIIAAGTTINLTQASNVMVVEPDWVPGNNAQAIMRVHRIGQTKPVHARYAVADGTLDEKIMAALKRKTRDLVALLDPMKPEDFEKEEIDSDLNKNIFEGIQLPTSPSLSNPQSYFKKILPEEKENPKTLEQTEGIDIFS